jgi:phosphatidylinositol alpha-mannosyltransferase
VLSVSSAAQAFAHQTFGIQSDIVPNTIDLKKFKTATSNQPGRIVFLGRLVPRKGARELIIAFQLVAKDNPEAELVIGGSGAQRAELEALVERLGIKKRVTFLGFVEEKDKADLLASAQIACFPALYGESFGIVLIEAMAAGAGVVIGGNNPGYTSVLQEQPECLFDPRSTAEFADRLHSLLNEPSAAARLHSWQARHVRQYDINVVGQRLEKIYRAAIANKTISRHN